MSNNRERIHCRVRQPRTGSGSRKLQKEETHSVPSREEYAGDLTSKSANWFRFQGAEQKVKRLKFLPQRECSQAKRGGTRQGNPLGHGKLGILSARDDRSSRRLVKAPAKHVRDGYGLI
jgi:hypothetical protein